MTPTVASQVQVHARTTKAWLADNTLSVLNELLIELLNFTRVNPLLNPYSTITQPVE